MQHGMEHRVGNFLKGLGCFAFASGLYFGELILFGEVGGGFMGWGVWYGIGMGALAGIVFVVKGISPVKYELRRCVSCGKLTEQFEKKHNVKEKQSEYVCERCGKQSIVPLCNKCKKPMVMADEQGQEWYCEKDATETASELTNRLTEDPQYEDAFKEWWAKTFPKKAYDRDQFLSWTKQYVDAGQIMFSKDGLSFTGVTEAVGKRYLARIATPGDHSIQELERSPPEKSGTASGSLRDSRDALRVTRTCPKCGGGLKEVSAGLYCFKCDFLMHDSSQSLHVPNVKLVAKIDDQQESKRAITKFCRECGAKIPRDSTFCEKCGANIG